MEKIIIRKQSGIGIRADGKMVRVSNEVDAELGRLSDETGFTKARLANYLLKVALDNVLVVEDDEI